MHHGQLLHLLDIKVADEWLDYNGHMNDAAYAIVFSRSIDTLMDRIHLDAAARKATGYTIYTMQAMLHYVKEVKGDAPLTVRALKSLRYLLVSDLEAASRLRLDRPLTAELDRHLRGFLRYVLDRDISTTHLMDELSTLPHPAPI